MRAIGPADRIIPRYKHVQTRDSLSRMSPEARPGAPHAIPEGTIKSECRDAGGTYKTVTIPSTGNRYSECTYTDEDGKVYTDVYKNGNYTGTQSVVRGGPSTPVPRPTNLPPLPPGATANPVAPGAAP